MRTMLNRLRLSRHWHRRARTVYDAAAVLALIHVLHAFIESNASFRASGLFAWPWMHMSYGNRDKNSSSSFSPSPTSTNSTGHGTEGIHHARAPPPNSHLDVSNASRYTSWVKAGDAATHRGTQSLAGSIHCGGEHTNNRTCRVKNLCYLQQRNEFILFHTHGIGTVLHGLPTNRFLPAIASVGGVADHNLLHFTYTDYPLTALPTLARLRTTSTTESGAHASFSDSTVAWAKSTASTAEHTNTRGALAPDAGRVRLMSGIPLTLLHRFKPDNVMHVLHDDIVPLHHTMQLVQGPAAGAGAGAGALAPFGVVLVDNWPWAGVDATSTTATSDMLLRRVARGPVMHVDHMDTAAPQGADDAADTDADADADGLVCFQDVHVGIAKVSRLMISLAAATPVVAVCLSAVQTHGVCTACNRCACKCTLRETLHSCERACSSPMLAKLVPIAICSHACMH